MIYIRDDDVLMRYKTNLYPDPFERFVQVHEWISSNDRFMHRPALLYWELLEFPECVDYIIKETAKGKMEPQLHGFAHVDHTLMEPKNLRNSIVWCLDWFKEIELPEPKYLYLPWGYTNNTIAEVTKSLGLEDVGIDNAIRLKYVMRALRDNRTSLDLIEGKEIYYHWWSGGDRIRRLVEHGSR